MQMGPLKKTSPRSDWSKRVTRSFSKTQNYVLLKKPFDKHANVCLLFYLSAWWLHAVAHYFILHRSAVWLQMTNFLFFCPLVLSLAVAIRHYRCTNRDNYKSLRPNVFVYRGCSQFLEYKDITCSLNLLFTNFSSVKFPQVVKGCQK